jgi:Tfp pilus assembly protein PilF
MGTLMSKLDIQLTTERSRPLQDLPVFVEVTSIGNNSPQRGYTDTNGRVSFTVPSGTRYQLAVSGPGIKSKTESFEISPGQRSHQEEVEVELQAAGTTTRAPGGMVSAANLRIPEKAEQEFTKGMKEMSAHNWSKAREHLEKAIKYYPQFDWAYNNEGVAYIQEKNTQGAREAFQKAVAINDKNSDAVRNLARMKLVDNDFSGVKELLLKLGPDPHDMEALMMLAYVRWQTREFDAALASALKVHQGDPDRFPLAHLIAARVYEMKGNQDAAQDQYQIYLKEAPDTPDARLAKEGMQRLAAKR